MYRKDTKFIPLSAESFREVVIQFNKDKAEYLEKHPELKEKYSNPSKERKMIIDFDTEHPKAQKEKLSLREKVNSFGIDLTSKKGIILLIIFIIIQTILLIEMFNN